MRARAIVGRVLAGAHRIDTSRPGSRVRVSLGGEVLAESSDAVLLREGKLPPRWYLPREDVRAELVESATHTTCPFKGEASYYSVVLAEGEIVPDLAWYYPTPLPAVADIAGRVCFFGPERVSVEVD